MYRPSLHRRRGNRDPAPSELRLLRTAVRTFPRELSRTYLTVPRVERDIPVLVNLEGGEELVSPRRKATPSHVPLLPHPEELGLSSRSVLRCPSPKPRPNGDAVGPVKPPQPQVEHPSGLCSHVVGSVKRPRAARKKPHARAPQIPPRASGLRVRGCEDQ